MTSEQATRIASRTFVAYLLFWVVSDAIAIPHELLSIVHEYRGPGGLGYSVLGAFAASYYMRIVIMNLAENILHIALWLTVAGWFYRCGPRIQSFFNDPATLP